MVMAEKIKKHINKLSSPFGINTFRTNNKSFFLHSKGPFTVSLPTPNSVERGSFFSSIKSQSLYSIYIIRNIYHLALIKT